MSIKPINSKLPAFSTLCSLYGNNKFIKNFEVTKVQYTPEDYDYTEGAYLVWETDPNGSLYLLTEDLTFTQFSEKREFGITNYHFTKSSNGYYVELGFYIDQLFISLLWNLDKNAQINYYKSVGKYPFKRLFLIPYGCATPKKRGELSSLRGTEYLALSEPKVTNILDVNKVTQKKLLEPCVNIQTDTDIQLYVDVFFNLDELLEIQSQQVFLSKMYNYLDVLKFQKGLSYPYKIEIIDEMCIGNSKEWIKYPDLVSQLFTIAPIYQRETILLPNILIPIAPFFAGGGIVGLTTGMAIDTLRYMLSNMLNTYYNTVITGHNNVYSSPCYNFTDIVVSNVLTNLVYIAPARDLYVTSYSSKLGMFIARFVNVDEETTQKVFDTDSEIPKFKVSEFPIDYIQQQFPDEYLFFDYPAYVKLQFDVSKYKSSYKGIYPTSKTAIKTIVGVAPIHMGWDKYKFLYSLTSDHYGNIPVNNIVMDWYKETCDTDWTKYNPNKWYIGKIETVEYKGGASECRIYFLGEGFGIPLGISVSKNVIEDIYTQIVDDINAKILDVIKNNKVMPSGFSGTIVSKFYFSVLFTDGNVVINGSSGVPLTPTSGKDLVISDGSSFSDGDLPINKDDSSTSDEEEHAPLWYYISSFYQPGKMVVDRLVLHPVLNGNLSRYSVYKILSNTSKASFFIVLFESSITLNYIITFEYGNKNNIKSVSLGTAGVPIVCKLRDTNEYVYPLRVIVDSRDISINKLRRIQVPGSSKFSYSKIACKGNKLYVYFEKYLFEYDISEMKLNIYKLKDELKIKKLSPYEPEDFKGIKLFDDFIDFISTRDINELWELAQEDVKDRILI